MVLNIVSEELRQALDAVCTLARQGGGNALVVGGSVRDALLGIPTQDLDIEVYGIEPDDLKARLASRFRLDLVGDAFGVIKLRGLPVDVSMPRRESKAGLGHKGFDVNSDPHMPLKAAAGRRDFTINAMAFDPMRGTLHDDFGGEQDLRAKVLRHTSSKFTEDPLRVLRGMQFVARFDLTAAPETLKLCAGMPIEGLARERIFEEWKKLILRGQRPSTGLVFLKDCGWLRYYPELRALVGCEQDPLWHPEGDVWTHTLLCMDAFAAGRSGDAYEDLAVGLAVLCHDFGKPATTRHDEDHIRSVGHSEAGEPPTRAFLARMTDQTGLIEDVVPLVREHLRPGELFEAQASDAAIRRLACRVRRIDRLVRVAHADRGGRGEPGDDAFPAGDGLLQKAAALSVKAEAPRPMVMGRHLIGLGLTPGPRFKPILDACYEAQIEGTVSNLEDGIALATKYIQLCEHD